MELTDCVAMKFLEWCEWLLRCCYVAVLCCVVGIVRELLCNCYGVVGGAGG